MRAERDEESSADRPEGDAARGLLLTGVVSVSGDDPARPSAGESLGESMGMAVERFTGVEAGSAGEDEGDCTLTAPCGCVWLGELNRSGGEGSYSFVPGGGGDAISYVLAEDGLTTVPARAKPGGPEEEDGDAIAEPRTVSAASCAWNRDRAEVADSPPALTGCASGCAEGVCALPVSGSVVDARVNPGGAAPLAWGLGAISKRSGDATFATETGDTTASEAKGIAWGEEGEAGEA